MSASRLKEVAVIVATVLATAPLLLVFLGRNLHWLDGIGGAIVFWTVVPGLLIGSLGGVGLAATRNNPLWLLATVLALCAGYVWYVLATGMAMAHMH